MAATVDIKITVPTSGKVVAAIAAIAQARHNAKFVAPATPTVVTDVDAVKEMIQDYLIAVYQQSAGNTAAPTAQATIDAAVVQAKIDAVGAIT